MKKEELKFEGLSIVSYSLNTVIVGSGAAGLNAADRLYNYGQKDIAVVTEGLKMGTSRNTGSDKQTYYKLNLAGKRNDSIFEMAETLFNGGSMDGDIALVEAALSAQSFYRLVDIGVPFPHNRYGEYVGYKTDHDPRQRATSAGPLTSRYMTEKLEAQVKQKSINIFDGYQVIAVLTDSAGEKTVGLLALNLNYLENPDQRFVLFNCTNIIYAVGGPAGIYATSVYPENHMGATGIALEAGIKGKNLIESQYGIASIQFRWNLSGTYQQVLPRYISTKEDGSDECEFLKNYFYDPGKMLDAIFMKGYQWPFDPCKTKNYGSSLIDILVYNETVVKGRKVLLDYTKNSEWAEKSGKMDFSLLGEESYRYLKNSQVLFGTPIERLKHMNQPAVNLYKENGIDLEKEKLEIAVCAQHNNGGLDGNLWWESNLKHFFPVGEVNGTHGINRPGGSALNSGQVGSTRAAQYIVKHYQSSPLAINDFLKETAEQIKDKLKLAAKFANNTKGSGNAHTIRRRIGRRMSREGAHIRSLEGVNTAIEETKRQLHLLSEEMNISSSRELGFAFQNYDLLITQYVYLSAIKNYIEEGGKSRGSYLIYDAAGEKPLKKLSEDYRFSLDKGELNNKIQQVLFHNGKCKFNWRTVNPLPEEKNWFENVWNEYLQGEVIK